ncbi:MAG: NAD(P)H-dependent oxidoreductase [Fimbriimonadaceae bacterium]|nr:NAD(P)H-dependent oxidoreductase [Alphaproteobacteria bacterium]
MTILLRINSSSRLTGSHSASIADAAETAWLQANPTGKVITRNVSEGSIPVIAQKTIEGFYALAETMSSELRDATALSDTLIDELQSAETLLMAVPIYNFAIPAALKLWIDQVVRIGHTFAYEDGAFAGLTRTKNAIVACAYRAEGYLKGQPFEAANFVQPYLEFLLPFLGIKNVQFVSVQATTADEATVTANLEAAKSAAAKLFS